MKKVSILILKVSIVLFVAFVWIDYFGFSKRIRKSSFEYEGYVEQAFAGLNEISLTSRFNNFLVSNGSSSHSYSSELNEMGSNNYNINLKESNNIALNQSDDSFDNYYASSENYNSNTELSNSVGGAGFSAMAGSQQLMNLSNHSKDRNSSESDQNNNKSNKNSGVVDGGRSFNMGDFTSNVDGGRKYDDGAGVELQGPPPPPKHPIPLDGGVIVLLFACIGGASKFFFSKKKNLV